MVVQIAAYWRNDVPGGVGFIMTQNLTQISVNLAKYLRNGREPCAAKEGLIDILTDIGSRKGRLSDDDIRDALFAIAILEYYGEIPSDEYNGLCIMEQVGRDCITYMSVKDWLRSR